MSTERLAVNAIDEIISRTDLLEPSINRGDKEPSWDGFIYAYRNKKKKKDQMYGRAAIQVKGTKINPKKKDRITISVSYADIENYREDGGAIYFVVYIDEHNEKTIFYAALLPYTLNDLLETNKGKRTFSLKLMEFPIDTKDVENLVINFIENCHRQSSPIRKNWTLDELTENFNLVSPQIKYRFTDVYKYNDPMDYLFNHFTEMYVPVEMTKQEYPIGSAKLEMIQTEMNLPVKAGGKKYYDSYIAGRNKDGFTLSFGNGVLSVLTSDDKTKFTFKIGGTLSEQLEKEEFLLAIFDSGFIEIGDSSIGIDMDSLSDEDKAHIHELRDKYAWDKDLKTALEIAGVKEELSFQGWGRRDAFYASQLIKALLYNEPVKLPESLEAMSIINIGNIGVGVLCQKLDGGQFSMKNMFDEELNIVMILDQCNIPTSQYVVMKSENFLQLSNINYDVICKSIKRFHSPEHYAAVNNLALQMLFAYDEKEDRDLLKAVINITKWLHQENPENPYYLINWYQSVYRKNKKDKRIKRDRMQYLIDNGDIDVQVGAAIIIGEHEFARELLIQMSDKKKQEYNSFPIINLLS